MLDGGGGGGGGSYKPDTVFNTRGLNDLKAMLESANVQTVNEIAQNWQDVHDLLVGSDGTGGIKKQFEDAVNKVLETWHGDSADGFAKEAMKISTNLANGAPYAAQVSNVMENTATALKEAYGQLMSIEEPSMLDSGLDFAGNVISSDAGMLGMVNPIAGTVGSMLGMDDGRSEAQLNADLANPNFSTADALERNRGQISEEKERSLQAAVVMENLAVVYKNNAAAMGGPGRNQIEDTIPEQQQPTVQPIGSISQVPTSVSNPKAVNGNYKTPTNGSGYKPITATPPNATGISGGTGGISGGVSTPKTPTIGSNVGTGLDGFTSGSGTGLGSGASGNYGGAGSVGAGSSGAGSGTSGLPGVGGSTIGGAGAGRSGSGAGRAGTPGMGGAAGAGRGGAGAGAGAGKGGPLARQKGGVVGAAKGKPGGTTQGGSGLHRSRGGTQAGRGGAAGMAGAAGARGRGRGGDEEGRQSQRPDYLVEDEETWTTERNVAPRVIE